MGPLPLEGPRGALREEDRVVLGGEVRVLEEAALREAGVPDAVEVLDILASRTKSRAPLAELEKNRREVSRS